MSVIISEFVFDTNDNLLYFCWLDRVLKYGRDEAVIRDRVSGVRFRR